MPTTPNLRVGGFAPLSTCDWPGELAATVFLQGCPWDCVYCHNPHLLPADADDLVAWADVLAFLETRRGLLDGVVFSGGEPLGQAALVDAVADVRERGFRVALHTSGVVPKRFAEVLPSLSWVGLDVKAPFSQYEAITRVAGSGERARESAELLVASGVDYEVRTTLHPALLGDAELLRIADALRTIGVRRWVIQSFRTDGVRPGLAAASITADTLPAGLGEGFEEFSVRVG